MKFLTILAISTVLFLGCNGSKSNVSQTSGKIPVEVAKATQSLSNLSKDTLFQFDAYDVGKLPSGWSQFFTGKGKMTDWKIVEDEGRNVLAQLSQDRPNYHFNDIVFDGFVAKDVMLKVKLKGVKGRMDQGGGFVWRWQDKDNYYVVRANPLEDNVVLYKVENGKRTDLPILGKGRTYGIEVPTLGSDWNSLKVDVKGNLFIVYLNCDEIFQVQDETFAQAGKVGLWTKADAVTYFDEFQVVVE